MTDTTFHALRYLPQVPLKDRAHAYTVGRWSTWVAAEDARLATPASVRDLLEVVTR